MCRVFSVSESGFYDWTHRPPSNRAKATTALADQIAEAHRLSRGTYGRRRIKAQLKKKSQNTSEKRIGKIMKAIGLRGISPRKFRKTTIPDPKLANSPNLLKNKGPLTGPNQAWVSDITFIPTSQGWLYLCVVIDLWSRKVVGMSMADHMRAELVESALKAALGLRSPKPGLIFHSDCGGQYKASVVRRLLSKKGVLQSMTFAGNCYDNATAESFFGTLKTELGKCQFSTRGEAESTIFEYIESFYNRTRIHSSLGYFTPDEFERQVA